MKIVAISDLHGYLPDIPKCDLLLIAGDICPAIDHSFKFQRNWLTNEFCHWINKTPARNIAFIAGNHDWYFENVQDHARYYKEKMNKDYPNFVQFPKKARYLQDSSVVIDGLKIYGSPWQPMFCGWAFNLTEAQLNDKFKCIPDDVDVLITHGPPNGYGDVVGTEASTSNTYGNDMTFGSTSLLTHVERAGPRLHVFGHIHTGSHKPHVATINGRKSISVNVSYVDERYLPVFKPFEIDL